MAEKKKASTVSRLASTFGFLFIVAEFLMFGVGLSRPVGSVWTAIIFIVGSILIPLFGLLGIILGIVALCILTPEEKQEGMFTSGTTKNLALVGIIVPPVMFGVWFLLGYFLSTMK
ncbi:MAG: hypothetical protein J5806_11990 [Lentisphaeria bacterium]|nr:hypothetical protein [Lentisphaeria bacterium]